MRYILSAPEKNVLKWLLSFDSEPNVLPLNPGPLGLVVAHLVSGKVIAEALPSPQSVQKVCGAGVPLGRLYFKIPREEIIANCEKKPSFDWP